MGKARVRTKTSLRPGAVVCRALVDTMAYADEVRFRADECVAAFEDWLMAGPYHPKSAALTQAVAVALAELEGIANIVKSNQLRRALVHDTDGDYPVFLARLQAAVEGID